MNGYLMFEKEWVPGEDLYEQSHSPENSYGVVLEYDGETLYFYAVERDMEGSGIRILDALHIWEKREGVEKGGGPGKREGTEKGGKGEGLEKPEEPEAPMKLKLVWSRDWQKCALVIDGFCHALFDFVAHGGYNVDEFPPPNENWTKGDRKLTPEIISRLF